MDSQKNGDPKRSADGDHGDDGKFLPGNQAATKRPPYLDLDVAGKQAVADEIEASIERLRQALDDFHRGVIGKPRLAAICRDERAVHQRHHTILYA